MPPNEKAQEIASRFSGYAKNGDESLINEYTEKEIELAIIQYSADQRFSHYSAMERRLQELKEKRKEILSQQERKQERDEGFKSGLIVGIISGVIGGIILAITLKVMGLG